MEIRIFHCFILISCGVLTITYLEAKPVSLIDIIAAEQSIQHTTTSRSIFYTLTDAAFMQRKKTSPLKYRKTFEIKSPSKPKKLKLFQKPRYNRKNLTKKREINYNDKIIQKYIPLLKNLRLFFDNILGSESSETYEPRRQKFKRNQFSTNERDDTICTCERKSDTTPASHPQEANTIAKTIATKVQDETVAFTITTTTPAYITVNDNVRRVGWDKNVPLLFTRNSTGVWRNDCGLSQGGGSSFNRSSERYITRDNGNNERNTRRETESYTEIYEEFTDSYSRNDASSDRSCDQQRYSTDSGSTEDNRRTSKIDESTVPRNETFEIVTRNFFEHEREMEYKIRGYETESPLLVPEFPSRLRRFNSEEEDTSIRRTKTSQESTSQIITSDKRISNRNGPFTSKNQEISTTNKAIAPKHVLPNSTFPVGKVVMIFDGYSVAKDVNGNNKLTEKAVHIHT